MDEYPRTNRIFDLLQLRLQTRNGGSVTLTYPREELERHLNLITARNITGTYWPDAIVKLVDDTLVILDTENWGNLFKVTLDQPMELDCGVVGTEVFTLYSYSLKVEEWDPLEEVAVTFIVDDAEWADRENNAEAALSVAETIEAQLPEHLEVIAKYMTVADELGSGDAHAWLADYYGQTDSKYDAYV